MNLKYLIGSLTMASTLASAKPVKTQPDFYQGVFAAQLQALGENRFASASVYYDGRYRKGELVLNNTDEAASSSPFAFRAYKISEDECGLIITRARARATDGTGRHLRVIMRDGRFLNGKCRFFAPVPALSISVQEKLESGEMVLDSFEGNDVALIKPRS